MAGEAPVFLRAGLALTQRLLLPRNSRDRVFVEESQRSWAVACPACILRPLNSRLWNQFGSNLTIAGVAACSKRFIDEKPLHLSCMRSKPKATAVLVVAMSP